MDERNLRPYARANSYRELLLTFTPDGSNRAVFSFWVALKCYAGSGRWN